jgi:DNA repair exonuclease SbcCD ATPase subunit
MKKFADTVSKPSAIAAEIEQAQRYTQKLTEETDKLKKRLPIVEAKVAELSTAIASTKQERQRLAALEENTATVDKQLEKLQKEFDAKSDEAAGINALVIDNGSKLEKLASFILEKTKEKETAELFAIYDEYNKQAAILGPIVKQIFEKRVALGMLYPYTMNEVVDEVGALQSIPALVTDGIIRENSLAGHKDYEELYFWQLEHWQRLNDKSFGPIIHKVPALAQ